MSSNQRKGKEPMPVKTLSREPLHLEKIVIPEDYRPSEEEAFMNPLQLAYFRKKLLEWKKQIILETQETLEQMPGTLAAADAIDVACGVMSQSLELRARDRERKLIYKIDEALQRIEDGSYGYCEETGEPISLKRLEARPIATLSIEAQERHERKEREYSE
ncbi:RNA polymerase-binding transcription factor DksA [Alphaproteobacteria bacterium]|nr:RNA polymerase-binding transcription factor DksA [Alphaproteobacteria bacterium]GHS99965.1 RNA polymerase-binding transcription factor DksA [Alphaproteobacteria bacterium]